MMILVAGSANLDFVVRAPHIPAPGETVMGRDFKTYPGGKGANQAVASARAGGANTHMLLALGNDAFAAPIEASLNAANVALHTVRAADQPTGTAFICVGDDAQNAITVAPGANHTLQGGDLAALVPSLAGFSHLLMQLEIPLDAVMAYATAARASGIKVVLNAAPAQRLPADLMALLDVLVVNEGELAALTQANASLEQQLAMVSVPCVVVTLGSEGCLARVDGNLIRQSGFVITPVDTTAAGDTFCGALVAALANQQTWPNALRRACAAGALACLKPGAQSSIPHAAEVQTFLDQHPA
jgi:ribokinase